MKRACLFLHLNKLVNESFYPKMIYYRFIFYKLLLFFFIKIFNCIFTLIGSITYNR